MTDLTMAATYAKHPNRIKKEDLCMILAFWMEQSPLLKKPNLYKPGESDEILETLNGVGAVLVTPNDMIFALDCSRKDDAHGVASLLMKFPSHVQDSTIYSSRKPCSFCTKLLVQCRVAKVFYLPIEPERNDTADIARVDHLFKVSQVAQRVLIPNINKDMIKNDEHEEPNTSHWRQDLKNEYWSEAWVTSQLKEKLPWLAFDDQMKIQVNDDMENMFHWLSQAIKHDPNYEVRFKKHVFTEATEDKKVNNSGPDVESEKWQDLARHTKRIADIISYKTDDPKTGVGAVILMENKEIVAVGWNGFPSKTLYGDFPRASKNDDGVYHKKYSYVLHAEQNALLNRNRDNIASDSTTLFVTKTPCSECVPLLIQAGVKNVVFPLILPPEEEQEKKPAENTDEPNYKVFKTKLEDGSFRGFESYEQEVAEKNDESPVAAKNDEPPVTGSEGELMVAEKTPSKPKTDASDSKVLKRKQPTDSETTFEEKDKAKKQIIDYM